MKKIFMIIIISALLLTSFDSAESNLKTTHSSNNSNVVSNMNQYLDDQNDLIYHDYGTTIQLKIGSSSNISLPKLNLKNETAVVYLINCEKNNILQEYEYSPGRMITYSPTESGVYKVIAKISNGETIDLTPKATVHTEYSAESKDRFLLLN